MAIPLAKEELSWWRSVPPVENNWLGRGTRRVGRSLCVGGENDGEGQNMPPSGPMNGPHQQAPSLPSCRRPIRPPSRDLHLRPTTNDHSCVNTDAHVDDRTVDGRVQNSPDAAMKRGDGSVMVEGVMKGMPCLSSQRLRRFLIASSAWRWPMLILWLVLGVSASASCFMIIYTKEMEINHNTVKSHCDSWAKTVSSNVLNIANEARTLGDLVQIFQYDLPQFAAAGGGGGGETVSNWSRVTAYVNATTYARPMVGDVAFAERVLDHERSNFERRVGWTIRDPGGGLAGSRQQYAPIIFRHTENKGGGGENGAMGGGLEGGGSGAIVSTGLPALATDMLAVDEETQQLLLRACAMRQGHALGPMGDHGIILEACPFRVDSPSTASSDNSPPPCRGLVLAKLNFSGMVQGVVNNQRSTKKRILGYVYDVTNVSRPTLLYDPGGSQAPCLRETKSVYQTRVCLGDPFRKYRICCRNAVWISIPDRAVEWTSLLMLIVLLGAYIIWASTRSIRQMKRDMDRMQVLGEEMRDAKNAAEVANKAKGSFLATISHEMRTPMNGILGMLKLLSETPLDVTQHDYVETARMSGNTLFSLINDVLDLSKIEAGCMILEAISFDLREEVDNVLGLFVEKSREQPLVELAAFMDDLLPDRVIGDPLRFRQVLVNLVGNALKFTGEGHIFICVRMAQPNEDFSICSIGTATEGGGGRGGREKHRFSFGEKRRRSVELLTGGGDTPSSRVSGGGGRWRRSLELTSSTNSPAVVRDGGEKEPSCMDGYGGGRHSHSDRWEPRSKFVSAVVMMDDDLTVDVTPTGVGVSLEKWLKLRSEDAHGGEYYNEEDLGQLSEVGGEASHPLSNNLSIGTRHGDYPTLSGLPVLDCPSSWSNIGDSFSGRPVWCGVTVDDRPVRIIVSVEDTGCGIPWKAQKTVGKPFIQADTSTTRLHGGTGIGLSISQRLVRLMGGKMGFCSRPGLGSTFFFDVLFQTPPSSAQEEASGPSSCGSLSSASACASYPSSTPSTEVSSPFPTPVQLDNLPPVRRKICTSVNNSNNGEYFSTTDVPSSKPGYSIGAKPQHEVEDNPFKGLTVVVLDDKHVRRMVAACHIKRLGAWVEEVESIDQATNVLRMASLFLPLPHKAVVQSSAHHLAPPSASTPSKMMDQLPLLHHRRKSSSTQETSTNPLPPQLSSPLQLCSLSSIDDGITDASRIISSDETSAAACVKQGKFQIVVMDEGFVIKHGGFGKDWRLALTTNPPLFSHAPHSGGVVHSDGVKSSRITHSQPNMPSTLQLLLIVAVRQPSSRAAAEEAGFDGVLVKPYRRSTLTPCLSEALTGIRSPGAMPGTEGSRSLSNDDAVALSTALSSLATPVGPPPPAAPIERENRVLTVAVGSNEQKAIFKSMCKVLEKRQVLVVDDNCVNRKVVGKLLGRCGAEVTLVEGGRQAIEKLKEKPFDCIFMDVQMPEMDGFEATRHIRRLLREGKPQSWATAAAAATTSKQEGSAIASSTGNCQAGTSGAHSAEDQVQLTTMDHRIPVIALTADIQPETRSKCYESGMDTFLTKPIVELELLHVLEECLIPKWTGTGRRCSNAGNDWMRGYPVNLTSNPLRDLTPSISSNSSPRA